MQSIAGSNHKHKLNPKRVFDVFLQYNKIWMKEQRSASFADNVKLLFTLDVICRTWNQALNIHQWGSSLSLSPELEPAPPHKWCFGIIDARSNNNRTWPSPISLISLKKIKLLLWKRRFQIYEKTKNIT